MSGIQFYMKPMIEHQDAKVGIALSVELLGKMSEQALLNKQSQAAKTIMQAAQNLAQLSGMSGAEAISEMNALALKVQAEEIKENENENEKETSNEEEPLPSVVDTGDEGAEQNSEPTA